MREKKGENSMNEENTEQEGLSLVDIFRMLYAHWIAIVVTTVIGAAIGFGIGSVSKPQYQASMKVYIQNINDGSTSSDEGNEIINSLRIINTFIDYLTDSQVAKEAVSKMETENLLKSEISYRQVMNGLSASTSKDNTLCVTVYYTHTDSVSAKIILENVILSAQKIAASPNSSLTMFKDRITTAASADEMGKGEIAEVSKVSKGKKFYTVIGAVVGLVIGIVYALLRELLDNTIKSKSFIEEKHGIRVIGSVPAFTEDMKNEK